MSLVVYPFHHSGLLLSYFAWVYFPCDLAVASRWCFLTPGFNRAQDAPCLAVVTRSCLVQLFGISRHRSNDLPAHSTGNLYHHHRWLIPPLLKVVHRLTSIVSSLSHSSLVRRSGEFVKNFPWRRTATDDETIMRVKANGIKTLRKCSNPFPSSGPLEYFWRIRKIIKVIFPGFGRRYRAIIIYTSQGQKLLDTIC